MSKLESSLKDLGGRVEAAPDGFLTMSEWTRQLNVSRWQVRERIAELVRLKKWERRKAKVRGKTVPVYGRA